MKARAKAVRRSPAPKLTAVRRAKNTGYSNYGANLQKKSLRGWTYYGGDAKRDIEDNINTLRQRSRDALQMDDTWPYYFGAVSFFVSVPVPVPEPTYNELV